MEKIQVSYEDSLELERLQYEIFTRKNILIYLIQSNSNKKEYFNKYHQEYILLYKKYEQAKFILEKKYMSNFKNFKRWDLDFNTQILTIHF